MKKFILILSIFLLLIFTTIVKNSTKEIENNIYDTKENLRSLKTTHEMVLLDYNYLSSPKKLLEYQYKYFENELREKDIRSLKKITLISNRLKIDKFISSKNND